MRGRRQRYLLSFLLCELPADRQSLSQKYNDYKRTHSFDGINEKIPQTQLPFHALSIIRHRSFHRHTKTPRSKSWTPRAFPYSLCSSFQMNLKVPLASILGLNGNQNATSKTSIPNTDRNQHTIDSSPKENRCSSFPSLNNHRKQNQPFENTIL